MRPWTRREVLAALGSAAALPLLPGCGAGPQRRTAEARPDARRSLASLRAQLRDTVAALDSRIEGAYAAAQRERVDSASADAAEIATGSVETLRIYLGGRQGGRWREVAIASSDQERGDRRGRRCVASPR